MKRIARITIMTLLVCLVLSVMGCANEGYVKPELPEGYKVEPTGRIRVSTYLRSGKSSEIAIDNWIKEYNELYPKVTIKKDIIEWAQFPVQVAAGEIGDVYYSADCDVYKYAWEYKAAMPLDAYVENLNVDVQQLYTAVYDLGCYNGLLYMVPSDLTRTTFYTNVTLLEEEGLSIPSMEWTWDDFLEYCRRVRKVNDDGSYSQVGLYFGDANTCYLMPFFTGWGGKWVDTVNKKVFFTSDEKVLLGVSQVFDLIDKGYAGADSVTGEAAAKLKNVQYPQNYAFIEGFLWQDRVRFWEAHETLGLRMNVSPMPKMPVIVMPGEAFGYLAYSKTRNPDAAATFVLFLLTQEGQIAFNNEVGGGIPTTKEGIASGVWRIPYPESEFRYDAFTMYPETFVAIWPECYVPPEIAKTINEIIPKLIPDHYSNKRTYDNALKALEQQCNEAWAKLYGDSTFE